MSTGSFSIIGTAAGAAVGSAFPGVGTALGAKIGATLGSVADALTISDPAKVVDARWTGATYGTSCKRVWGSSRIDCEVVWAVRNSNGSYLFPFSTGNKLKGTSGTGYTATWTFLAGNQGWVCPDGTQISRPTTWDRLWFADQIAWQSAEAAGDIGPWISSTTYNYGDLVSYGGNDFFSISDANTNNVPLTTTNTWWNQINHTNNIDFVQHPGPTETVWNQAADSTMVANDGISNVSAMRGYEYGVVDNFSVDFYGGLIPQSISLECHTTVFTGSITSISQSAHTITAVLSGSGVTSVGTDHSTNYITISGTTNYNGTFLVLSGSTPTTVLLQNPVSGSPAAETAGTLATILTVGDYFGDIARLSGMSVGDFDFTAASDPFTGMYQNGRASGQDLLNPVLAAYAYDIVQIDGIATAVKRGGAPNATVPDTDLGASKDTSKVQNRMESDILTDRTELHSQLTVNYKNQNADFRTSGEQANRNVGAGTNPYIFQTDMSLTPNQAANMAWYLLATEWLEEGSKRRVYLPGSYSFYTPTDRVLINNEIGILTRYRIDHVDQEQNYVTWDLVRDEPSIVDSNYVTGDNSQAGSADATTFSAYAFAVASPAIDPTITFSQYAGFYLFGRLGVPGNLNTECWFTFDAPGGTRNWIDGGSVSLLNEFGTVVTHALDDASGPGYDTTSFTYVQMVMGTNGRMDGLNGTSVAAAQNGHQWQLIGDEWIAVVANTGHAQPIKFGPGLLRGLAGSPYTGHTTGEMLYGGSGDQDINDFTKIKVDSSHIGDTVYVQLIPPGNPNTPGSFLERSCVISAPTPPYTSNGAPVDPSTVTAGTPTYNGSLETLPFMATYTSTPPAGQKLNWQSSTDGGATWSSSTLNDTSDISPPFSSGNMMLRAQAITSDGRTGNWVSSANIAYVAPRIVSETPSGAINGTNVTFTLSHTPIPATLQVFKNGLFLLNGSDYTVSGATLTFAVAPAALSTLIAQYSY